MSQPVRQAEYPIEPLFLNRWSPRAYNGEEIPDAILMSLFEAARWAPSSYNSQPWRFVYAKRGSARWPAFLGPLIEFNQSWVKNAAVLVYVVSKKTMVVNGKEQPSRSHSFDAGAAWCSLALQAWQAGWPAHGMVGFDFDKARSLLGVPDGFQVEAAVAIGRLGDKSALPEALQQREAPTPRKPLGEIVFEGGFPSA